MKRKTYSETVRHKLHATGLPQMEIAKGSGVAQTTVSAFLRGKEVFVSTVEKLDEFAIKHMEKSKDDQA